MFNSLFVSFRIILSYASYQIILSVIIDQFHAINLLLWYIDMTINVRKWYSSRNSLPLSCRTIHKNQKSVKVTIHVVPWSEKPYFHKSNLILNLWATDLLFYKKMSQCMQYSKINFLYELLKAVKHKQILRKNCTIFYGLLFYWNYTAHAII